MEYFTALIFAYTLNGMPVESLIVFDTYDQCEAALRLSDGLYTAVEAAHGDAVMTCRKSSVPSRATVRPKARPF